MNMRPNHDTQIVHASCVAIGNEAVLFSGPSGAGKSDLALRLIDRGAKLVADDQVILTAVEAGIITTAPVEIAGKMEVRSIGIVEVDHVGSIKLSLSVRLTSEPDRFPLDQSTETILNRKIPAIYIDPTEPSAPIKIEMALKQLAKDTDPMSARNL